MREIKFRVWEKTGKVMDYQPEFLGGYINTLWEDDGIVFMQYTGLKDRNGVEIYEGDIYTFDSHRKKNRTIYTLNSIQDFFENKGLDEGEYGWDYSKLEVIGNIYENLSPSPY